ncbi:hypothetical protein ASD89_17450 [Caulobacter sp. Root656]|nr:hypothetical protein ASD89_17450 [Caulobacter sp. Root656]
MIVGQNAQPPYVRRVSERELRLAAEQCLTYADKGDLLVVDDRNRQYAIVSIGRWQELSRANRP